MSFDLVKIWHDMDWMARGVVFALTALALGGLAVFIERLIAFARSQRESRRFALEAGRLLDEGKHAEVASRGRDKSYRHSHLARLLAPTLEVYVKHEKDGGNRGLGAVELTRRELARRNEEMQADLRRGFSVLASVGSVAPFVGLLGTVVGIIATFTKIKMTGSGGLGSVSGGISEALVVTALGLLVAIPSVLAFNFLTARADGIQLQLGSSSGQVLDYVEDHHLQHSFPVVKKHLSGDNHGRIADSPAA